MTITQALPHIILFLLFVYGLHRFVQWDARPRKPRGATPEPSRAEIIKHQQIRRIENE